MHNSIKDALRAHWRLLVVHGGIMTLLGILAVGAPMVATLTVELVAGWLFLFSGVSGLVAILSMRDIPAFAWSLVTAALSTVVGILLLWHPEQGAISLTLVLTAFLLAEGVFQSATAIAYREVMGGAWGWVLLSGITDLALALLIILGLPSSASYTLGIIVGVNLITSGWALLMIALIGRRIASELAGGAAKAA